MRAWSSAIWRGVSERLDFALDRRLLGRAAGRDLLLAAGAKRGELFRHGAGGGLLLGEDAAQLVQLGRDRCGGGAELDDLVGDGLVVRDDGAERRD